MRIRPYFAGAFCALLLLAAYLGLFSQRFGDPLGENSLIPFDKALHFITFFLLTLSFYWIIESTRRRVLHFTILTCTIGLGIGSEVLQGFLPNGRDFDPYDILFNLLGSGLAISICSWYHKRMLERKRASKAYALVPGEDEADLELGEGTGSGPTLDDEEAVPVGGPASAAQPGLTREERIKDEQTLEQEVDNWDENEWDEDDEVDPDDTDEDEDENKKPVPGKKLKD